MSPRRRHGVSAKTPSAARKGARADATAVRDDRAEQDLRAVLNGLPAMIGYWDRDLRNRMANEAYVDYFGLRPDQMRGIHIRDLLGAELFAKNLPYMERALAGEAQLFDRTIIDPSGEARYTQASYIPDMAAGEVRGFFVLVTDITARRTAELALAAAEHRFRTLFDRAPLGSFLVGADGVMVDVNEAAAEMLGRPREELIGLATADISHPEDVALSKDRREQLLAGEIDAYRLEKRYLHHDGHVIWAQLDARLLSDDPGEPVIVLGQIQDITERRNQQAELERLATHDALTGLLNRRGLLAELERLTAELRRYGGLAALLILDLDHFKSVNDTLGHRAGDDVLVAVSTILRTRLRESDVVARQGGDEFAVILKRATPVEARRVADAVARRIRDARLGVATHPISVSVGVTMLDEHSTVHDALVAGDAAMYAVKRAGGDAVAPAGH